jgi:hypothetical protein
VSRRGVRRKRKRSRDIAIETSNAMEECASAAEVGRRWDGVSD